MKIKWISNIQRAFDTASISPEYKESQKFAGWGWHIIVPGQLIRLAKIDEEYVFPQFMRHHMSNIADSWTAAAMLDYMQMGFSAYKGKDIKSKPITCAGAALALMTTWEVITSQMPGRKFDWTDQSLHTGSAIAYVLAKRHGKKPTPKI
jgi:hypothetical protein